MIRFSQLWPLLLLLIPIGLLLWQWEALKRFTLGDRISFGARLGVVALGILALSGPQLLSWTESHYVYFLADLSKSVSPQDRGQLLSELRALAKPQEYTQYGLIVFGVKPYVEAPFSPMLNLNEVLTNVDSEGTDLQAALELAMSTFPRDGKKTIVLLSDGQPSQGETTEALARAKREGVEIFTLPMDPPASEFSIQTIQAPQEVAVQLPFSFQSVVYASRSSTGKLLTYRNETLIDTKDVALRPGLNYFSYSDKVNDPGSYEYRAELVVAGDALPQNNHYRALVDAIGDPRILLVENNSSEQESVMGKLLKNSGYAFSKVSLNELAPTASSLLSYRAVIMNEVPLKDLTARQTEFLENYVRDLGGGLFLVQGRQSVEEFYDRQFEQMLPITYEGPQEIQRPALALVMLLDRSGSMGEIAGGDTKGSYMKIDLLKQAAREAVSKLDDNSLVGIIGFDSTYDWLVDIGPVKGRKDEILAAVDKLYANGGTDIYQPLKDAVAQLQKLTARVKHILVFSDGKVSQQGRDFDQIFQEIAGSTISASSIAIGAQADFDFMWKLADAGSGAKYPVADARDLPRITLEEMVRLERARWVKGPLGVEAGPFANQLTGIDPSTIPNVDGYVLTFEKPTAQTQLQVRADKDHADPLVSQWHYGLGKVFVLNTSFEGEGLERWKSWSGLGELSSEILSQVYSESTIKPKELAVWTDSSNSTLSVHVEADRDGKWLDQLVMNGQLNTPDGKSIPLDLEQTGPGTYQATVKDLSEGVYLLNLGEDSLGQVQEAVQIPYAAEYKKIGLNEPLLQQIAEVTGGEYLENPDRLQGLLQGRTLIYRDIWQEILLAALFFFLADLALRKVPFLHA
ncbi:VWA domain-containing protein [Candidatus Acetothermia bacterium]|nr:VWA domain-containing protein [Candidatus Acetothermia bacterium]MBI3643281.1 VWA domain-containing protein [Candidatus Acetothermia bacterium]